MKISVVTVTRNSAATLHQTVESFLQQRYPLKEMLLIDARSTDQTVSIAASFRAPNIHIVSEEDDGLYDAMNKGLRLFSGDAVGFLNSDDTFRSEDSLDLIAGGLQDADVVFGDLYMVTDHHTKRIVRTWKSGDLPRSAFRRGWMPPHPTFYVRRAVVEIVGGFDLRYNIGSDYDFMLRVMSRPNQRIRYVPHFLVDYRVGGLSSGTLKSIIKANLECLDSRRRHLNSGFIDLAFFLRPLRRLAQVNWSSQVRRCLVKSSAERAMNLASGRQCRDL
ncbi:MAG TPA: glycosyltransferase family 2 protein [Planctomycetaceae bacterium]|nr:glycosyltransferase family 2 protein [Planctomycetaceae bacterium]